MTDSQLQIETGVAYPLEPVVGWTALVRRLLTWAGLAAVAAVLAAAEATELGAWLAAHRGRAAWLAPFVILHVAFPLLSFRYWSWSLGEHDFRVGYGVFTRQMVSIPLSRIQQVDSHRGVLDRWLGITRLQVHSAGSRAARVDLPGVAAPIAEELRARLTELGDRLAR